MPSVLWSPSASVRGLRRFACVIASLTQAVQACSSAAPARAHCATPSNALRCCCASILISSRIVLHCAGAAAPSLRVDLRGLLRVAFRIGQQASARAERVRDRGLDPLRGFDRAVVAILLPQRSRPVHRRPAPARAVVLVATRGRPAWRARSGRLRRDRAMPKRQQLLRIAARRARLLQRCELRHHSLPALQLPAIASAQGPVAIFCKAASDAAALAFLPGSGWRLRTGGQSRRRSCRSAAMRPKTSWNGGVVKRALTSRANSRPDLRVRASFLISM